MGIRRADHRTVDADLPGARRLRRLRPGQLPRGGKKFVQPHVITPQSKIRQNPRRDDAQEKEPQAKANEKIQPFLAHRRPPFRG